MKHFVSLLLATILASASLAADQKITGTIDKVDASTRTIVIDGKPLVVSPKTKFIVDGKPSSIDRNCIGKRAVVVYDDKLDVALSIVLGETISNDDAVKAFDGSWRCIAGEEAGRELDRKTVQTQNRTLTCKKHRLTMERVSNATFGKYEGIFVLDASTNEFDFVGKSPKGEHVEWTGIYDLTNDELKLCYRDVKEVNVTRPVDFKTDAQKPAVFYTYKRIKSMEP